MYEGPFDVLLHLISKHRLEVTELALHEVTDEFIAYIKDQGESWDLNEATEFLVIASTLLDLKAARLLPSGEVEDEEDLAVLEARDLLFARLLQYKAYKEVSLLFAGLMAYESQFFPRVASLEPQFAAVMPDLKFSASPEDIFNLAIKALSPKPAPPTVGLQHLHAPAVSVREQGALILTKLQRKPVQSFRSLIADADSTAVVVARFLALLELYRERVVSFEQPQALGDLLVRWLGVQDFSITDEFDIEQDETNE